MNKTRLLLAILLVMILLISGCGKKGTKKPEKIEQKERAPEVLKNIYNNVEEILETVEKEEGKNQDEEKKNEVKKSIDEKIREIHEGWNKYEVEGTRKGATTDNINKFRESLNNLTLAIENLEYNNILKNSSELFLNMAPLFNLYKDEIYGEICLIKYYVYEGYIFGEKGEIAKGEELLSFGEGQIDRLNIKIEDEKDKRKDVDMLKKSIENMKFSLKSNNKNLLKIKKDIVMKNLKRLVE